MTFYRDKELYALDRDLMLHAKQLGFSDQQIAKLTNTEFFEVRRYRKKLNIIPVYKTVDTCSAEFSSSTPYHYSTYEGSFINLNSTLSISALKDASIIFSETPIVYQLFLFASELSIETLVIASVPVLRIRTL